MIQGLHGYTAYTSLFPNANNVKGVTCVGHTNQDDPSTLNAFGYDFASAGRKWTQALCLVDSDGDGRSNGQELGDPDCSWRVGDESPEAGCISDP
ncbi:temptin precursor, partial [Elysia marginata]